MAYSLIQPDKVDFTALSESKKLENEFTRQLIAKLHEMLENSLRRNAKPPIKGKITTGKLKWRGIKMIQRNSPMKTEIWLEQRGVKISETFALEITGVKIS